MPLVTASQRTPAHDTELKRLSRKQLSTSGALSKSSMLWTTSADQRSDASCEPKTLAEPKAQGPKQGLGLN